MDLKGENLVQAFYKYFEVTHIPGVGMLVAAETRQPKKASLPPRCGNLASGGWARDRLAPCLGFRSHHLERVPVKLHAPIPHDVHIAKSGGKGVG